MDVFVVLLTAELMKSSECSYTLNYRPDILPLLLFIYFAFLTVHNQ